MRGLKLTAVKSKEKNEISGLGVAQPLHSVNRTGTERKKELRVPRTRRYINAMKQVDQLSEADEQIMDEVQALPVNNELQGILATCYIEGCIIHAIDRWGNILQHYISMDEMPVELQEGYEVYEQFPTCMAVEVYSNTICVVADDGSVKCIERKER